MWHDKEFLLKIYATLCNSQLFLSLHLCSLSHSVHETIWTHVYIKICLKNYYFFGKVHWTVNVLGIDAVRLFMKQNRFTSKPACRVGKMLCVHRSSWESMTHALGIPVMFRSCVHQQGWFHLVSVPSTQREWGICTGVCGSALLLGCRMNGVSGWSQALSEQGPYCPGAKGDCTWKW